MPKNSPRTGPRPTKKGKIPEIANLQAGTQKERTHYVTAIEWGMAKINDPDASDDLKYRIMAVITPFQVPRLEARIGKKEREAEAAKEKKPQATFEPAPTPVQPHHHVQ